MRSNKNSFEFNRHYNLEGKHALLGASQNSWLNYDASKMKEVYLNSLAKERGTRLHNFAKECIALGQKLPNAKKTLNMYVNDSISFKMKPEVLLYYSDYCFGTTDAIAYYDHHLQIHDYKSGVTPAKIEQLMIYNALFCLEYKIRPSDIDSELRIYQNNVALVHNPCSEEIDDIIRKIIEFDKLIREMKENGFE